MMGRILRGDARKALTLVTDESMHLVVTSPPYNVAMGYDVHDDEMPFDEWKDLIREVLWECWRKLVPGGRMAVNITHGINRDPLVPVGSIMEGWLLELPGVLYRGPIVWHKRGSMSNSTAWGSFLSPSNPALRGTFEMIYVVSKGSYERCDRSGPGDAPRLEWIRSTLDVWEMAAHTDHSLHPAPFPVELAKRLIQLYTWPGDHVLDPFAGSGTTGLAALHLNRDWTMVDVSEEYCARMQRRCVLWAGMDLVPVEVVS